MWKFLAMLVAKIIDNAWKAWREPKETRVYKTTKKRLSDIRDSVSRMRRTK